MNECSTDMNSPEDGGEARNRTRFSRLAWHHLYFVLAAFDLLTVGASLYLTHHLNSAFENSVTANAQCLERLATYKELGRLASAVNAPGNDVFDSRDVPKERARMNANLALYLGAMEISRASAGVMEGPIRIRIEDGLETIELRMKAMLEEAGKIFSCFERNEPERAGERMATMDRRYAEMLDAVGELQTTAANHMQSQIKDQANFAASLRNVEFVIGAAVVLMIGGITYYGHRLSQNMAAAAQTQTRYTADLETLSAQLQESTRAAESATRAKSEFLAHMSHEIRTPINGVAGMLDLLTGTALNEQQRRFAELARTSVSDLTAVINSILDFSKIEAGKLDINSEDFDLQVLIEDVVLLLAHRAQQKGLELTGAVHPGVPRRVRGDPDRVRQVLTNLVGNAIKFTKHGVVAVRAVLDEQSGPGDRGFMVRFTVSDTGIGIPPERLQRLFKAFSQADSSTTRLYGGTGLGLAISKHLTELMGGAIGVVSDEGRGSTFWFTISFQGAAGSEEPKRTAHHLLKGRRILLIGGSCAERETLRQPCTAWGLHVDNAADLLQARTLLSAVADTGDRYFAVIVDSQMEGFDLYGFSKEVSSHVGSSASALLVQLPMTTTIDPDQLRAAGYAGALLKPARHSHILDALMNATVSEAPNPVTSHLPATPIEPARVGSSLRLNILIAEDNEINQIVANEQLSRAGHSCEIVGNGRLAVEAIRAKPEAFDLVLMDCQMPEMDGLEATREIRRLEQSGDLARRGGRRLPIVALTANALAEDIDKCMQAEMDEYMTKPLDENTLITTIERVAGKFRSQQSRSSEANVLSMPETDTFDMEGLRARCSGRVSLMESILRKFEASAPKTCSEIDVAIRAGNMEAVAAFAHRLKGSASTIGANVISAEASQLEIAARDADLEAVILFRAAMCLALESFCKQLPEFLAVLAPSASVQETRA